MDKSFKQRRKAYTKLPDRPSTEFELFNWEWNENPNGNRVYEEAIEKGRVVKKALSLPKKSWYLFREKGKKEWILDSVDILEEKNSQYQCVVCGLYFTRWRGKIIAKEFRLCKKCYKERFSKACKVCGKRYVSKVSNSFYCSDKCRKEAKLPSYRKRRKEENG